MDDRESYASSDSGRFKRSKDEKLKNVKQGKNCDGKIKPPNDQDPVLLDEFLVYEVRDPEYGTKYRIVCFCTAGMMVGTSGYKEDALFCYNCCIKIEGIQQYSMCSQCMFYMHLY